jgi:hypothetical protein
MNQRAIQTISKLGEFQNQGNLIEDNGIKLEDIRMAIKCIEQNIDHEQKIISLGSVLPNYQN